MRFVHSTSATALFSLLKTFSWQELRHHPWRNAAAIVAVMLGVALAFAVHLINASALDEFAQAARSINGQPDIELRNLAAGPGGGFDEAVYVRVAGHPDVAVASPVLEISTYAIGTSGNRHALRILGVDAFVAARISPQLMPQPQAAASVDGNAGDSFDALAVLAPQSLFLNASAQSLLQVRPGGSVQVQAALSLQALKVRGSVAAPGGALAVMDLGAAQDLFGQLGQLSRIDVKLKPGAGRSAFLDEIRKTPGWPTDVGAQSPADATDRLSSLSRAYRVNMTVLALVALFTGAFLVFSVLSLSVAKRAQQFALLGVLGLTGGERLKLVLLESAALGLVGSLAGVGLGAALAAAALTLLGGDLGGGYFTGAAPALQWRTGAAAAYAALGLLAALAGGWWPAQQALKLPSAQTLKGLAATPETHTLGRRHFALGLALMIGAAVLAALPALFGLPIAAYLAVGVLLVGGMGALPGLIGLALQVAKPLSQRSALPMLAIERARRVRAGASAAVSGVVASLSLAVALTVMVASFRESVSQWLGVVLPADLYVRTASSTLAGESAYFTPEFARDVAKTPGVVQSRNQRTRLLQLAPSQAAVALLARDVSDAGAPLPLLADALAVPEGAVAVYVSEAMVDLYGATPGSRFAKLNQAFDPGNKAQAASFFVAGVWRDYARQGGSIAMDSRDYVRLTGDTRINDMALWLDAGHDVAQVQQAIRMKAGQAGALIEFATAGQIRAVSLKIFDRSFAVTYWLQAVAIGIGLFGIAASFSAQVLARRKEFGLLAHLGFTRWQVLAVVAGEGLAWTSAGALAGLALGLAVALILVHVVNPQSFHWTMTLAVPWLRLAALCLGVVVAGTVTAWLAGRAAVGQDAVMAVKEDW